MELARPSGRAVQTARWPQRRTSPHSIVPFLFFPTMYHMGYNFSFPESRMHLDTDMLTALALLIASISKLVWSVRRRR
jgi:hypothetical protein